MINTMAMSVDELRRRIAAKLELSSPYHSCFCQKQTRERERERERKYNKMIIASFRACVHDYVVHFIVLAVVCW
jgi:hypothetical protein